MFIVIEGIDGSGTTTQTKLLASYINKQKGQVAIETKEPTEQTVGRLIREILINKWIKINELSMALLFAADRLDHMERMEQHLDRGLHIVCDRYLHSSLCYQGTQETLDFVAAINAKAKIPDVTYILEIDPKIAHERILSRGEQEQRYDAIEKQKQIADNYDKVLRSMFDANKLVYLQGDRPKHQVHKDIVNDFNKRIGNGKV